MLVHRLLSLPEDEFFKLVGILLICGGFGVYYGFHAFLKKRKVEDTACSRIASAPQGLVEVEGQAWPTVEMKSVEGRPVCYWHLKVQKRKKRGRSANWVTVYEFQSQDPLIVYDGTAACLVVPEKAQWDVLDQTFYLHKMTQEQRDQLTRAVPEAAEYFSMAGQILGGVFGGGIRVVEQKILAGSPVYARGEFATQQGSLSQAVGDFEGYQSHYAKISSPGYQARLFDTNQDGFVSDEEFISGHAFAANPFVRKESSQTVPLTGHLFWSDVHGLLLADTHQNYLLHRLGFTTLASLWGGVLILSCAFFLIFLKIAL